MTLLRASCICIWLLSLASVSYARPPRRVSLHYTRAEGAQLCIDSIRLARKVEAYTGPVLVSASNADAAVEVHIEARSPAGFRARIQLAWEGERPHGERVLEEDTADCRNMDDALAFVIATTVDPDLVLERVGVLFDPEATPQTEQLLSELAQAPKPETKVQTSSAKVEPATVAPAPFTRSSAIGLGVALADGLPAIALGPALHGRLRPWRWLEFSLSMRMLFPVQSRSIDRGTLRTRSFAFSLLACPRLQLASHVALVGCLGPDIALLHAQAGGLDSNESGSLPSIGALLRPELLLKLSELWSIDVAAFVRISAPQKLFYDVDGTPQRIFASPHAAAGAELSFRTEF